MGAKSTRATTGSSRGAATNGNRRPRRQVGNVTADAVDTDVPAVDPQPPVEPQPPRESQPPVAPLPPRPGGVVVMPADLVRDLFRDVSGTAQGQVVGKPSKKRTALLLSIGAFIGSIVFALVNFFVVPTILKGEAAKPVGMDDALAEFRSGGGGDDGTDSSASDVSTATDPGAAPVDGLTDPAADAASGDPATGGATGETDPEASAAAALLRPPAGVYAFSASGTESTKPGSLSAETNKIGPTVAAVVRHSGQSCWSLELKFNNKHASSDTFCAGEGSLTATGGVSDSTAYGQKVHNEVRCDPPVGRVTPGMAPGASWQGSCTITTSGAASSTSNMAETWTVVGVETVLGTPAWHLRGQTQSSGGSNGTTTQDVWISQTNGMVLQFKRRVQMTSKAPVIGNVVYSEQIEGSLESLTPQT